MGGPEAGMEALELVEGIEQLLGKYWIGQRASRHSFLAGRRDRNLSGGLV
jgi:hypothetical protein